MSDRPTLAPDWATDVNFPAGADPWSGNANKVDPGASPRGTGFIPQDFLPAEWENFLFNNHGQWLNYLDSKAVLIDERWITMNSFPLTGQIGSSGSRMPFSEIWEIIQEGTAAITDITDAGTINASTQNTLSVTTPTTANMWDLRPRNSIFHKDAFTDLIVDYYQAMSVIGANNAASTFQILLGGGGFVEVHKVSADTNWQFKTGFGPTTTVNTGVPPVANVFQHFRIRYTGASTTSGLAAVLFIDDMTTPVATITTNIDNTAGRGVRLRLNHFGSAANSTIFYHGNVRVELVR